MVLQSSVSAVLDADSLAGHGVGYAPSPVFGLKKPMSDFWPDIDGVGVGFERLAEAVGGGWDRLRGGAFVAWASQDTGGLGVSLGVAIAGVAGSEAGVVAGFSSVLAVDGDRERVLGGLRVNMSLILRRLSTSNSGSKRPDNGNMNRDEYSCCRLPSLNVPGGFMISRMCDSPP